MTMEQIVLGAVVASGFFLSALVSRMFRQPVAGVVFGGVAGIALSVAVLTYGLGGPVAPSADTTLEN